MNPKQSETTLSLAFIFVIALIAITRFTSLKPHWGSLEMRPTSTITVSGTAKKDQVNQIASFTAGMESIEATKEEALNKANESMNQLISKVKQFGVKEEDIKTEQTTVYQETEYVSEPQPMELQAVEGSSVEGSAQGTGVSSMMYPRPSTKPQKGSWRANNSVSIKLREAKQAETLLAILNDSGANYVYGPNFSIDNEQAAGDELLSEAVANAKAKAESIANANKQKVGKIISVTEGGNVYPMYGAYDSAMPMAAGLSKTTTVANLEPGSSSTSKSVTVTFELN